jgi:hypothetical protein
MADPNSAANLREKLMKQHHRWLKNAFSLALSLTLVSPVLADTTITTFDNFNLDGLFAWSDATVLSTATNYQITDIGYGSGYKDINPNINAAGETHIELTVSLSGAGADGLLGPIVSLVDGDGTFVNYAWYGQTLGSHTLTAALSSGTGLGSGSIPGLDLSTLDFFHLQLDPSSFSGAYTVSFENLRLVNIPEPSSLALIAIGLGGLVVARRRR